MTDTARIFQWGIEGGRPASGTVGVQPEWFYKGDGSIVVRPGAALPVPAFAQDAGEVVGYASYGPWRAFDGFRETVEQDRKSVV